MKDFILGGLCMVDYNGGLWVVEPPAGSRGRAPYQGIGDEPRETESLLLTRPANLPHFFGLLK